MNRYATLALAAGMVAVGAGGAGWGVHANARAETEREVLGAVDGMYAVISGSKGEARDWDAFRAKFVDGRASMTMQRPTRAEDGSVTWSVDSITPEQYIESAGRMFEQTAFYERSVANRVEIYGSLAHVWSTYEAFTTEERAEPALRGINSFQLVRVDGAWKVLSLAWEDTRSAGDIPERYLQDG